MSVILMTTLFYEALIELGEIWCWSLLALKGWVCETELKIYDLEYQIMVFTKQRELKISLSKYFKTNATTACTTY